MSYRVAATTTPYQIFYKGRRYDDGSCVVWICSRKRGEISILSPYTEVWNHSPTGFEWGYAGSGPAQLALAILCDVCATDSRCARGWEETPRRLHQRFKRQFVVHFEKVGFELLRGDVRRWITEQDRINNPH
jgi:hypothetical protein